MWSKLKAFLRGWWYTRTQKDPEVVAKALGRPDTLELTDEQANLVRMLFCGIIEDDDDGLKGLNIPPMSIDATARTFYMTYPRSDFRYFMVPDPNGQCLEYSKVDYNIDGVELIYAAMRKLGAIVVKEDGEYFENAHPMVQRFAEIASKQTIPERKGRGILG